MGEDRRGQRREDGREKRRKERGWRRIRTTEKRREEDRRGWKRVEDRREKREWGNGENNEVGERR